MQTLLNFLQQCRGITITSEYIRLKNDNLIALANIRNYKITSNKIEINLDNTRTKFRLTIHKDGYYFMEKI